MQLEYKGRREDLRLVTGRGQYTADWNLPNQVHGQFLRSDRAHADIVSIDITAAKTMPGVVGIFTGEDAASLKTPPPIVFNGRDGKPIRWPQRPALAHGRVRFVGEPVALVVAETEHAARDAAEAIVIDYRDLPVAVEAEDALRPDAPQLHADIPGNLSAETEYGNAEAVDAAFAKATHVVRATLDAQRISGQPMEPKSALVSYDEAADAFDFYVPTQGMSHIQHDLSDAAGIDHHKIRVRARDVGGGFGVRNEVYPEFFAVFLAARALRRPVKWHGTRTETTMSDHHGRAAVLTGEMAIDKDGNFLALRIGWVVNLGAYCSNAGPFINAMAAPRAMTANAYRVPAAYGRHQLTFTNTTPTTAYRGAGRPNVAYLVERLVEEAALVSGIDRIELRRRNLIPKASFPYKTATGSTYDSGDPAGLLDRVLDYASWKDFPKRAAEAKKRGKLRGIGCALFIEPSGSMGQEKISIRFDRSGNPLLYALAGPSGQGHETVFPELVAKILGMNPETITLRYSDPEGPELIGTGSFGSRSLLAHGNALAVGAHEIVKKGTLLAAGMLEASADDVTFDEGRYKVKGTDMSVGLDEIMRKLAGAETHPLDTDTEIASPMSFPSGAHIAEVEIDPDTGTTAIINYVAVDDCGVVISPVIVEGQLTGGIMQGIGQAFGEHIIYDRESGQMLTGTFMDYMMPHATDWPTVALHFHPIVSPTNALGVKGAGEAGATGSIPCLANAVMHALAPLGVRHLDMPYTAARVWAAIQAAKGN